MNNKIFLGLVVLAAGVLTGWYFLKEDATMPSTRRVTVTPTPQFGSNLGAPEEATGTGENMEKGKVPSRIVVMYSDSGFAPRIVTVKTGTIVTFVNDSNSSMWVASDSHPTHTILPSLDELRGVGKGETYEFTFSKIGTWAYHNHATPMATGTVVVTQ